MSLTPSVCAVSGATVTVRAAGLCTIQATQAGNNNWMPAPPVNVSFTVGYGVSLLFPPARTKFLPGLPILVIFQLTDARRHPIADSVAAHLGCTVTVAFNTGNPVCAVYISWANAFAATISISRTLTAGASYPIVVKATAGTTTVATATTSVIAASTLDRGLGTALRARRKKSRA